ncbi:MAG: hypothetical protein K2I53_04725, partial [Lachnospiraceae bacterium]|nr:hypothetical protein [Lachnospiraceae bacterium]
MREMQSDKKRNVKRSLLIAGTFSFLFSAAILFGARLDSVENVDVRDVRLWLRLVTLSVIFTGVVRLLWLLPDLFGKRERREGGKLFWTITNRTDSNTHLTQPT